MCKLGRKKKREKQLFFPADSEPQMRRGAARRDQGEPPSAAAGVRMSTQPATGSLPFPSQSFITEPSGGGAPPLFDPSYYRLCKLLILPSLDGVNSRHALTPADTPPPQSPAGNPL